MNYTRAADNPCKIMDFEVRSSILWVIPVKKPLRMIGGPFAKSPLNVPNLFDICLQAEASDTDIGSCDFWMPIQDFSVPEEEDEGLMSIAILEGLCAAIRGDVVYAGCKGGIGRTGLYLALVLKAAGYDDPIKEVRSRFKPHAVETPLQERYVTEFDVSWINRCVGWKIAKGYLGIQP